MRRSAQAGLQPAGQADGCFLSQRSPVTSAPYRLEMERPGTPEDDHNFLFSLSRYPWSLNMTRRFAVVGRGWDCDRGYAASGNGCVAVVVPAHAHIDLVGSGWDCDRGYAASGNGCDAVVVPAHAHIDLVGSGWDCDASYKLQGG